MAETLKIGTVEEMLARISSTELAEWKVLWKIRGAEAEMSKNR